MITKILLGFFRILAWIDENRQDHPGRTQICTWALQAVLIYYCTKWIGSLQIPNPSWWYFRPGDFDVSKAIILGISLFSALFLQQFILRQLLPLLTYVPQSVTLKALGVKYLVEGASQKQVSRLFVRYTKGPRGHPSTTPIRVLCISGKSLFRSGLGPEASSLLLKDYAQKGLLHVLMPISDPLNPTIAARYSSFSSHYRAHHCSSVNRLVDEVEDSKQFLLGLGNTVYEHNSLIVWRLFLLERYCFVQNYFYHPEPDSGHIIESPLFVYGEGERAASRHQGIAKYSFYKTYAELWRLFKESAKQRTR